MRRPLAIGVDLGGTNTRVGLVRKTGSSVRIVAKCEFKTRSAGPKTFVEDVSKITLRLLADCKVSKAALAGIGIGAPGSIDVARGFVHFLPNVPGWKNVPLKSLVARRTSLPVVVDNDANAMALGECRFGAARGAKNAVFLTLGTGIGGGLLIGGKLFHGSKFSAAEIGHLRWGAGSVRCGCGARGCIETEIGNSYLEAKIERDLKRGVKTSLRAIWRKTPRIDRLAAVDAAAQRGDRYSIGFWKNSGQILGDFLAGICNLLNPEVIVIGGGMSKAGRFLFGPLKATLKKSAFPAAAGVRIVPAKFGADAGITGAASLAFENS